MLSRYFTQGLICYTCGRVCLTCDKCFATVTDGAFVAVCRDPAHTGGRFAPRPQPKRVVLSPAAGPAISVGTAAHACGAQRSLTADIVSGVDDLCAAHWLPGGAVRPRFTP